MGFLDRLRKVLTGTAPAAAGGGGSTSFGDDKRYYWIYATCRRCGEPLKGRVDLHNEPSEQEDGTWLVRKGLTGSGKNYCFQTVEVMLRFDAKKEKVVETEASGGAVLTPGEYRDRVAAREQEAAAAGEEQSSVEPS